MIVRIDNERLRSELSILGQPPNLVDFLAASRKQLAETVLKQVTTQ